MSSNGKEGMVFRYKTNKQALIIAALVILLCLVCLAGATLALFTDSGGAIGVVVTSGDVEVDIADISGETLQGKSLSFITSSSNPEPHFEPGVTFYTQGFQIKNTGDIPVTVKLSVSRGSNINAEEFNRGFEVFVVRMNGDGLTDGERITSYEEALAVGKSSDTYCLVVRMKETAGNEFQGKSYTGIGITVYAIQGNATSKG